MSVSCEGGDITYNLKVDARDAKAEIAEVNRILTIYLALGRRLGSEDLTRLITLFQRTRLTAEMLTRAMIALNAASGPWGWLLAGGQLVLAGLMIADFGTEVHSR